MAGKRVKEMHDMERLVSDFCTENAFEVRLSYHMPEGYETAYRCEVDAGEIEQKVGMTMVDIDTEEY